MIASLWRATSPSRPPIASLFKMNFLRVFKSRASSKLYAPQHSLSEKHRCCDPFAGQIELDGRTRRPRASATYERDPVVRDGMGPWRQPHAGLRDVGEGASIPTRFSHGGSIKVTGLKAAPRSHRMCMAIWRFCAGHPPHRDRATSHHLRTAITHAQFPREAKLTVEGTAAPVGADSAASGRRLLILTDAWAPQVNGVVRTLEQLGQDLELLGWQVAYATPMGHSTVPLPTYPEIRVALFPRKRTRAPHWRIRARRNPYCNGRNDWP